MSQIRIDELETNETLTQTDVTNIYQSGSGGLRRDKQIPINEMNVGIGMKLSPDRIAFQELTSGTLSVSGWYTIAEALTTTGLPVISADVSILARGSSIISGKTCSVNCGSGSALKDHSNTTLEIRSFSENSTVLGVKSIRLAKSDSLSTAGFKLQVYFDPVTSLTAQIGIQNNIATSLGGFTLVTPYLDNTPTLPDGVTVGTFLEAGTELSLESSSAFYASNVSVNKISNDQVRLDVNMGQIVKQGTGVSISQPSVNLLCRDGSANTSAVLSSITLGTPEFDGNIVRVTMTQVGGFTSLNVGPIGFRVNGTGCKITITG